MGIGASNRNRIYDESTLSSNSENKVIFTAQKDNENRKKRNQIARSRSPSRSFSTKSKRKSKRSRRK